MLPSPLPFAHLAGNSPQTHSPASVYLKPCPSKEHSQGLPVSPPQSFCSVLANLKRSGVPQLKQGSRELGRKDIVWQLEVASCS